MINKAIEYIIEAIRQEFDNTETLGETKFVLGNIAYIDAYQDESAENTRDKLIASVVNIAQEGSLRNLPFRRSATNDEGLPVTEERQPDIWLNVYILFGANRTNYGTALNSISKIIGFFQKKHVFIPSDLQNMVGDDVTIDLPNIKKLIFDLYSMNFDELNQLWGILGGKYIPSVLYKMRMAVIQESETSTSRPIEAIGASPNGI